MTDKWFLGLVFLKWHRPRISGCSQWFWHSCLASILSPVLCISSLATQYGSRVASAWSFVSGSVLWCIACPWLLHHHVLRAHLGFQSTGEWLLVVFPLYLGSHPRVLTLQTVELDHKPFLCEVPWAGGLEQEGSEWHGCTPPLILWLIAHSPLNKFLTGYQLAASPCQACSISHSHIVEAAAVGTKVFWKLMPGASAKWRLMVCDLSRGWPSEHTHGGGCVPCRRPEPSPSLDASP